MSREIKFRWYHKKKKIMWVISELYSDWTVFFEWYYKNWGWLNDVKLKDIELMQYTWLKDKNWKEIYEWDLIELQHNCWSTICEVIYGNWAYYAKSIGWPSKDTMMWLYTSEFNNPNYLKVEIIWNIYENSDLLNNNNKDE